MNYRLSPTAWLTAAAGAFLAHSALATDTLEPLLVTATRSAQPLSLSLSASTVLERADIERSQARDALELLRGVAGIDLARSGGPGSQTSLFMRGSNSNHVLVLIDGVRVSSATTGTYAFEFLPIEQIERIEIVRGPRASVWGSDAIGGVIQIFTRRDAGTELNVALGSEGAQQYRAAYGSRSERGGFRLGLERRLTDTVSAQNENGFAFNPDNDGLRRSAVSVSGDLELNPQHRLEGFALGSNSDNEFDEGASRSEQRAMAFNVSSDWSANWSQYAQLGFAQDDLATPAFASAFETKRSNAVLKQTFRFEASSLSVGADYLRESGLNSSAGESVFDRTRRNLGVFGLWQSQFGRQSIDLGTRIDDSSQFDSANTSSIAYGFQLTPDFLLYTSIGQGFRAPNFNELYSPGFGGSFRGNPNLDPERSLNYEAGLKRGGLNVAFFSNHIDDLIAFQGGRTFEAVNVREARVQGIELEHRWQGELYRSQLSVTFQGPKDLSAGRDLLRRPKQKANFSLDRRGSGSAFSVGGDLFVSGPRIDFGGPLAGYAVLDLRAQYAVNPQFSLQARLANLFDRRYELVSGFNTEQRSILFELQYTAL